MRSLSYMERHAIQWHPPPPPKKNPQMIYKTLHRKLKLEKRNPYQEPGVNSCASGG